METIIFLSKVTMVIVLIASIGMLLHLLFEKEKPKRKKRK